MWKDAYKIGIDQIDQQHKQMVETLQDLLRALEQGGPKCGDTCRSIMVFLKDYAVVHFGTEEMYQAKIGFPEAAAHKRLHDGFCEQLREMEFKLIRRDFDEAAVAELGQMLTKWWIWHILKEDKKMIAFSPPEEDDNKTENGT